MRNAALKWPPFSGGDIMRLAGEGTGAGEFGKPCVAAITKGF